MVRKPSHEMAELVREMADFEGQLVELPFQMAKFVARFLILAMGWGFGFKLRNILGLRQVLGGNAFLQPWQSVSTYPFTPLGVTSRTRIFRFHLDVSPTVG